jgi:hypothetical protein
MLQEDTGYSWDSLPNTLPEDNEYTRDLLPEDIGYSWDVLLKDFGVAWNTLSEGIGYTRYLLSENLLADGFGNMWQMLLEDIRYI